MLTVSVYIAPVWPCIKLPVCDLAIVRSGTPPMLAISDAESFAALISPPPETETLFVTLAAALPATFTVSVIADDPDAAMTPLEVQVTV